MGARRGRILALFMMSSPTAVLAGGPSDTIPDGFETSRPIGHVAYCGRDPSACSDLDRSAPRESMTPGLLSLLTRVNAEVNRSVRPVSDRQAWGVEERWNVAGTTGDCEDYSLLKAARLSSAGLRRENLLVAVVRNRGEGHAVLTVRTDAGDFVLDNLAPDVRTWNRTGYRFVKRQMSGRPSRWVSIGTSEAPVVASTR